MQANFCPIGFRMVLYHCDCGNWRCKKPGGVSKSTWYRHKLASIVQDQSELDDIEFTEPLPVEDASDQGESDPQHADLEQPEVNILTIS